ncbi:MAG: fused MFS/spermidine synthase, partial [Nitrospiria bacterium]
MRYFSLLFGNTAKGAAMVLIVFFLGMAIGSRWGGRRVARSKHPLRLYAGVEFGIALAAAPIPLLIPLYEAIYPWLYTTLETSPFFLDLVRFLMALGITLPAGIFLGATFPMMGEIVIKNRSEIGGTSGLLYGLNTLGAACGVILTGFFLPPILGISLTYALAVLTNLILGGVLLCLSKAPHAFEQTSRAKTNRGPDPAPDTIDEKRSPLPDWLLLGIAFGSGLGMISLEVLWTRMLALVFHNSVYSFSAIILIVLVGLSSGGFLISALQKQIRQPAWILGLSLGVTALLVVITPYIFFKTTGLAYFSYGAGWPGYLIKVLLLTAGVILLPTLSAGVTLPLVWGMYGRASRSAGASIGEANLWNLLGGIVGGWGAGFLLIPTVGLWKGITAIAVLYLILSQITLSYASGSFSSPWIRQVGSFAIIPFVTVAIFVSNPSTYPVQRLKAGERLLYLQEGEEAVVSVVEDASQIRWLKSNNTYHLGATVAVRGEKRLGHLPLLLHPSPKEVACVGIGTGS